MIAFALFGAVVLLALLIRRFRRNPSQPPSDELTVHACGASNPPDANYCRRCGESLKIDLVELIDENVPE